MSWQELIYLLGHLEKGWLVEVTSDLEKKLVQQESMTEEFPEITELGVHRRKVKR
jgi:hypothetical protein